MKRVPLGMVTLLLLTSALASCAHIAGSDWATLIDGHAGLDNWNRIGDANWRAKGEAIAADKGKGGPGLEEHLSRLLRSEANSGLKPTPTAASSSAVPTPAR